VVEAQEATQTEADSHLRGEGKLGRNERREGGEEETRSVRDRNVRDRSVREGWRVEAGREGEDR
jgi:hypothetical protein